MISRLYTRIFLCLGLLAYSLAQAEPLLPKAVEGVLDVSTWKAKTDPFLYLEGQWRVYWMKQESEAELASGRMLTQPADALIKAPGTAWADIEPGKFPPMGHATHVLEIKGLDPSLQDLAIVFSQFYNLQRTYVYYPKSQTLLKIADVGRIGTDRASEIMQNRKVTAILPLKGEDRIFLVQQTSSYHIPGGMGSVPTLGDTQRLLTAEDHTLWQSFLVLGMFALLIISNFSLFILRPEDKPSLMMALFALIMGVRYFSTEGMWSRLSPEPNQMSFQIFYLLLAWALFLGLCCYLQFFYHTFSGRYPRWALIGSWSVTASYMAVSMIGFVIPTFPVLWAHFMLVLMFFAGLMFIRLLALTYRGTRGAALSLLGITLMVGTMANDVFIWLRFYDFIYVGQYGMIAFIFAQSLVVASNFSQAFRTAETLSRDLQKEVERQTRDVKTILANIHQGILTVRGGLLVGDDYSRYLEEILGTQTIANQNLLDLVFQSSNLTNEKRALIDSVMTSSISESSLNFEMNSENLPKEFIYRPNGQSEKTLIADWEPVIHSHEDRVEKVLLTLRDVTELKQMEARNKKQQREMELIAEIIEIPIARFDYFMEAGQKFLHENRRLLVSQEQPSPDSLRIVFINYHTMKGAARTYHFSGMTSLIHDAEQTIAMVQKSKQPWDRNKALSDLQAVETVFSEYLSIHSQKLRRGQHKEAVTIELETVRENIRTLEAIGQVNLDERLTPFVDSIRRTFYQLYYMEFDKLLKEILATLPQLARDLQKLDPKIELQSSMIGLTKEASDALRNVFVHIFRNIMDHGIEAPEQRQAAGKPPQGTITIQSELTEAQDLLIRVKDDGQGIRLDRIHELALQRQFIDKDEKLSPSEIAELIFVAGFSTAKGLTDVSGRGVGMSAVREYIAKEGGTVHVRLLDDVESLHSTPFELCIVLPTGCFTVFNQETKVA